MSLLVLGSGEQADKGYILEAAARTGRPLVLVKPDPPTWEQPLISGYLAFNWDEAERLDELAQAASQLECAGVFTYVEHWVPLAGALAERLGLPGPGAVAAAAARNKRLMRQQFAASGVPAPQSVPVACLEQALAAAGRIGYPVVLKPESGLGSVAVVRADSAEQLAESMLQAEQTCAAEGLTGRFLVEEYVAGPEFSVEGVVYRGEFYCAAVTGKQLGPEPYFEELGHVVPAPLSPGKRRLIVDAVARGVRALGLQNCAIHGEVRLSASGPKVIEIAARMGGDLIGLLVRHSTGIDFAAAAIAVALGQKPELKVRRRRQAAVRFLVPECPGRFSGLAGIDEARAVPGVVGLEAVAHPGDMLGVPPAVYRQRLGAVVAVLPEGGDALQAANDAADRVRVLVEHEEVQHAAPVGD